MSKPVRFTAHARQKFDDLADMGFLVSEDQVVDAVSNPDSVDTSETPATAQKSISDHHVLRVVFVEDFDGILVITFYPGRKKRYDG
ncbi:MAG: DUF4258 domain-containing protein [Anaerolineae bacterium]|nr:DUF4258 domain-containing protein [Anaerolineae bacterium]